MREQVAERETNQRLARSRACRLSELLLYIGKDEHRPEKTPGAYANGSSLNCHGPNKSFKKNAFINERNDPESAVSLESPNQASGMIKGDD
jgi:hypothetical protein